MHVYFVDRIILVWDPIPSSHILGDGGHRESADSDHLLDWGVVAEPKMILCSPHLPIESSGSPRTWYLQYCLRKKVSPSGKILYCNPGDCIYEVELLGVGQNCKSKKIAKNYFCAIKHLLPLLIKFAVRLKHSHVAQLVIYDLYKLQFHPSGGEPLSRPQSLPHTPPKQVYSLECCLSLETVMWKVSVLYQITEWIKGIHLYVNKCLKMNIKYSRNCIYKFHTFVSGITNNARSTVHKAPTTIMDKTVPTFCNYCIISVGMITWNNVKN